MEECISSDEQVQSREHCVDISMRTDEELVYFIKEKMENLSSMVFIFKVPELLRSKNEKAYTPDKISIGPIHYKKPVLKEMETIKWQYLFALLNRKPNLEASLDKCVKALRELEHRARNCYEKDIINLNSDDFVQMLLVDCSFIIELFLKYAIKGLRRRNDRIFSTKGILFELRSDLLLLENQIPFFVLHQMFEIVPIPRQCTESLNDLASRFFKNILPGDQKQYPAVNFNQEAHHLLELIRRCILPSHPNIQTPEGETPTKLDPATKLKKAGIKFKKGYFHNFSDLEFSSGVLRIPSIKINKYTEKLLRNLIAFEQNHFDDTQHITSYAILMDRLISSERDVKLLGRKDIIRYFENKEVEVNQMFKNLCKEVKVKKFYYVELFEQVNEYKTKSLHAKWLKLKQKYDDSPFSFLVFLVAVLLLVLVFVAGFFSLLSFSLHH